MTSISQERADLSDVGQRLRRREEWGARRSYTDARAVSEPATRVFVHITITNPSNYASDDAHARAVEAIGIARFPNTGISYNRMFFQSGGAYEAQPIGRRGAHTVNDFRRAACTTSGCPGRGGPLTAPDWNLNVNARAYVICQNVGDTVTDAQLDAVARAIAADMLAGFVVRTAEIHGHRCVSAKSCPGDRMWARMPELRGLVDHYLRTGLIPSLPEDDVTPEDIENIATAVWHRLTGYTHSDPNTGEEYPQKFWHAVRDNPELSANAVWWQPSGLTDENGDPVAMWQLLRKIDETVSALVPPEPQEPLPPSPAPTA